MKNNCVCLICFKPNNIWFVFLSKFTNYDIYIIIDDNSKDYKEQYLNFSNINVIQIKNEDCINNGFVNTDFKQNGHGWSKALYYFSSIQTNYNYVWFVEDDVFFYDEMTLLNIDAQFSGVDLLTNSFSKNELGKKNYWNWPTIDIKMPPPYYNAMCCASRMCSSSILLKIKDYANSYKTLFFHEALSPTICHINNYSYKCPIELQTIIYRKNYNDKDINENNMFHPVKDINKHTYYRDMLNKKKNA